MPSEQVSGGALLLPSPAEAAALLAARTASVDGAVRAAWAELFPGSGSVLLAVGGYGRGRLFPHSDVDLLVIASRDVLAPAEREWLAEFLRRLWDSGLRASHSVRTVKECCTLHPGNEELAISLLDHRLLAGDAALFEKFRSSWRAFLHSRGGEIADAICRMFASRNARFRNTIYHLEPDVKEGPGGLRDLQTAEWLALLSSQPPPAESATLLAALAAVRIFLHFRHGRDNNLLDFDSQDAAAAGSSPPCDAATWMRNWYQTASAVRRLAEQAVESHEGGKRSRLSSLLGRWRGLSTADFTVSRGLVYFRNPGHLEADPELPLRLFLFVARHGARPARETGARIEAQYGRWASIYRPRPAGAAFWRELLSLPCAAAAVRAMRDSRFLPALLAEWERIEHRVAPDFRHEFTVDEHTNVALESLEAAAGQQAGWCKPFADLWTECERDQWRLRLALLLHDAGKGSGRDHVEESESIARRFLEREGFAARDASLVLFLIRNHLLLSAAMQGEDVADPAVQERLARSTESIERLRLLTLMTWADISAVSPGLMTEWRAARLLSLYRTLYARLEGALEEPFRNGDAEASLPGGEAQELLAGLPGAWRRSRTPEQMERDARLLETARRGGAEAALVFEDGAWTAVVAAPDRPRLFASLAGAISAHGMEILECEAYTHRAGLALDTFRFVDPHRTLELNRPEQERLAETLRRAAEGRICPRELLRRRPVRRAPARIRGEPPSITFMPGLSGAATVIEVVAPDRPALLYDLAEAISDAGCDIRLVLVDTRAHKAIDVFHVTRGGRPLDDSAAALLRERLAAACKPRPAN